MSTFFTEFNGLAAGGGGGGSGANQQLSNLLAPTSVNADLIPNDYGTRALGAADKNWSNVHTTNVTAGGEDHLTLKSNSGAVILDGGTTWLISPTDIQAPNFKFFDKDQVTYVGLKAADTSAGNVVFTLPNADGDDGQFLKTDGSGVLSFATNLRYNEVRGSITMGVTPGGGVMTADTNGTLVFGVAQGTGAVLSSDQAGSLVHGSAVNGGEIQAGVSAEGAQAFGFANETDSAIYAASAGALAHGAVTGGAEVEASANGSVAHGRAETLGAILGSGDGAIAHGYVLNSGIIEAPGPGAIAHGQVNGVGSLITAGGAGSTAQGFVGGGGQITVTGNGSHVGGYSDTVNLHNNEGNGSIAHGMATESNLSVIGDAAQAFGDSNYVNGFGSTAFGLGNNVSSTLAMIIGRYGEAVGHAVNWIDTDPIFAIGVGPDISTRAIGYRIDKDGRVKTTAALINAIREDAGASVTISARVDRTVVCSNAGAVAVVLPPGEDGLEFIIKNASLAGAVTITPNGAETIDDFGGTNLPGDSSTSIITPGSLHIQFLTNNWHVIGAS